MSDMNPPSGSNDPPPPPPPPGGSYPPPPPPPPPGGGYAPPPSYTTAGGGAGYSVAPGIERAGFGNRLVALIIDSILLGIVTSIFTVGHPFTTGANGISALLAFAYYGYFEGGPAGQTIGKKVMNIRVVRVADGGELGWGTALLRHLCRYLSAFACGIGFLWMLWDKDKMTWHDKLSQTLVVPTSVAPVAADAFGKPPRTSA